MTENNIYLKPKLTAVIETVGRGEDASEMEAFFMAKILFFIAWDFDNRKFIVTDDGRNY